VQKLRNIVIGQERNTTIIELMRRENHWAFA